MCHSAPVCPLVLRRSRPIPIHRFRVSVSSCPLKGVGPVRTRLRISTSRNMSMKLPPIGLVPYVRIGPSLRKRASTTSTISFARPLRLRDGGCFSNHLVQLRRVWYENSTPISPPMSSKSPGAWHVGKLQRAVYQPILQS